MYHIYYGTRRSTVCSFQWSLSESKRIQSTTSRAYLTTIIILFSIPRSCLPGGLAHSASLSAPVRTACPTHLFLPAWSILIIFCKRYKMWCSTSCKLPLHPATYYHCVIVLNAKFSDTSTFPVLVSQSGLSSGSTMKAKDTPSLCQSINARQRFTSIYTYNWQYLLIFTFSDSRWVDKIFWNDR